jgi:hypothetical protein
LAAIALLVGVPALADTGVPGLPGGGSVTADPPPPVNVPIPVPEAVQQVQQTVQATAGQAQQAAQQTTQQVVQQVAQAAAPQRNAPARPSAPTKPSTAATSRSAAAAQPRIRSSRRQAFRRSGSRASLRGARGNSVHQLRSGPAHRTHARGHRRGGHHAARHFAAPHPIARPLPAAVLRSLSAQPPKYPTPPKARAHHSRLPFAHLGLPAAPSMPVLLLLLGGIGLAMLALAGTMPSGFRNTSVGRRWRRLRSRRVTV